MSWLRAPLPPQPKVNTTNSNQSHPTLARFSREPHYVTCSATSTTYLIIVYTSVRVVRLYIINYALDARRSMRPSQNGMASRPPLPSDNVDFSSTLRSAAPRRRRTAARITGLVTVLEDAIPIGEPQPTVAHAQTSRSLPQFQHAVSTTLAAQVNTRSEIERRKSRVAPAGYTKCQGTTQDKETVLKKQPRRRTIWIPSDDTTVLTIHPGNHDDQTTTSSILPGMKPANESQELKVIDTQGAQPRRTGRRKSLAQAPRRGIPLQPTLKPLQEVKTTVDYFGAKTGKENVPPGQPEMKILNDSKKENASQILMKKRASMLPPLAVSSSSSANVYSRKRDLHSPEEWPRDRKPRQPSVMSTTQSNCTSASTLTESRHRSAGTSIGAPVQIYRPRRSTVAPQKYPLLYENIEQSCMFEDSWLSNQETAITELVNCIFSKGSATCSTVSHTALRHRMLRLYQDRAMLILYQRLHASLQFGALSLPKERESAADALRFENDVGLRKQFKKLWTRTYNEKELKAAVEVVVGRQIRVDNGPTCHASALEEFICSCLLRNEDSSPVAQPQAPSRSPSWRWRRTMQRGLMLIKLLDKSKESGLLQRNLFRSSSRHKTSASVLSELISIIQPWGGDVGRALGHIDFQIHHIQHPLSEFDYTVTNLAVDLRDGVRLTRLTELLLHANTSPRRESDDQTISMPTGEVLDTTQASYAPGPLSQHLRYPCVGYAVKVYNCQIALSALLSARSTAEAAAKTSSSDIVDGHREQTLALLWALVGHWGLNSLIDWDDVRSELLRIAPGTVPETLMQKNLKNPSYRTQNRLLREWANALASKHSLTMHNMTTAFSDGLIFERIVDEYRPFLKRQLEEHAPAGLESKLKALGCSAAFTSIFGRTSSHGSLFDEDFTNATLAFLCSRLLGPSKQMRERMSVLKRLAADCATVVQTREEVFNAAVTLQRAWRMHFASRLERYEREGVDIWLTV